MKSLFKTCVFLLLLLMSTPYLFAEVNTALEADLQSLLNKKTELSEKEKLVKLISTRVQAKIDLLLKQGKTVSNLTRFMAGLRDIDMPFPLPHVIDVPLLDRNIRAGKVTLQARAHGPTPIFYTGSLHEIFGGETGTGLMLDEYNQIDPLETIALPGTTFQIVGVSLDQGNVIYQVTTPDYPYETDKGYFIDARFVDAFWMPLSALTPRAKILPSQEVILENLRSSLGLPYIWGGDVPTGVPELLEYYPPKGPTEEELRAKWTFRGVDCSGLLYAATNGSTPRNTSELVYFGTGIEIAGKTSAEIIPLLRPLDIIAWKGHTLIVLNQWEAIQSKADYGSGAIGFQNGVKIDSLRKVLDELTGSFSFTVNFLTRFSDEIQ